MTFFYLCHRQIFGRVIKNSLLALLLSCSLSLYFSAALAQSDPKDEASTGWEVSDASTSELEIADQSEQAEATDQSLEQQAQAVLESDSGEEKKQLVELKKSEPKTDAAEITPKQSVTLDSQQSRPVDTVVEVAPIPDIPTRPVLDIDEDLRRQLESQFQTLQALRDTEDAFSEKMGETFFSYGDALQRAGRLEEAQDMFVQALHLNKINNGVNSISQRPIIRSLAGIELAKGDLESADQYVRRMIWLEKQQSAVRDTYSFDIILLLANKMLDQYLYRPVAGESNLFLLNSASNYFRYLIRRYGDQPLDSLFMPYGELAYAQHLKGKLAARVDNSAFFDASRSQRARDFGGFDRRAQPQIRSPLSIDTGERDMRDYLMKARRSGNTVHIVQALLNVGDINHLFGRSQLARNFYRQAWLESQNLDENHELVKGMSRPHKLPSFFYALDRNEDELATYVPKTSIPLEISVSDYGEVKTVFTEPDTTDNPKLTSRARRAVKRILFRPAIVGGEPVGTDLHTEYVRVTVRKGDKIVSSSTEN